jgi:hypothetical protein
MQRNHLRGGGWSKVDGLIVLVVLKLPRKTGAKHRKE